jgi:SAM-dependent methyltransferase
MGNELKGREEHSAEHFGDTRDHWWNLDFLRLMAKRWRLDAVHDVLDVGCGVGHWGRLLASVMPDDVRVTGVDRERAWVDEATARAPASRFSYRQGDAQKLPFPDDSFDLTTCQTLLIHLPDPSAGIAEMIRVTKPGGLVAVAEPNNMTESVLLDSISNRMSTDDIMELVRFQLTCERGKVALGEGDNSLGDRVPGLFVELGLADVDVFTNDKATAVLPPYESDAQRAFVEDLRDRVARRLWNWGAPEGRRYFLAGGGAERDFDAHFARGLASREAVLRGIEDRTYHGIIGGAFYLVAGRKRSVVHV